MGATFGRTGDTFGRTKGVPGDYAEGPFIERVTPTYVDFVMHSRPFFLSAFDVRNYLFRTKWRASSSTCRSPTLAGLAPARAPVTEQIGDCFRAAGFSQVETKAYTGGHAAYRAP